MITQPFDTKIIFVIGGVLSGIGKGSTTAALAHIFKSAGLKVSCMKHDPYLNWSAAQIHAEEHGEVFVTKDGHLTDLDLGSYERFTQQHTTKHSSVTLGQALFQLISEEKAGLFQGKTIDLSNISVQLEKHINETIAVQQPQLLFVEVGGNVDDQNVSFILEAIKSFKKKYPKNQIATVFITYLIHFAKSQEFKARAAFHSLKKLQSYQIEPDIVIFRTPTDQTPNYAELAEKCQLLESQIFVLEDVENVLQLPKKINSKKICNYLFEKLNFTKPDFSARLKTHFQSWTKYIDKIVANNQKTPSCKIAICHQYKNFKLNYGSQFSAFELSQNYLDKKVELVSIDLAKLPNNSEEQSKLKECSGVFISSGVHKNGFEGKVFAANYARLHNVPLLATGSGIFPTLIDFARDKFQIKIDLVPNKKDEYFDEIESFIEVIDPLEKEKKGFSGNKPIVFQSNLPFAQKCQKFIKESTQDQVYEGRFNMWLQLTSEMIKLFQKSAFKPVSFTQGQIVTPAMFELENHPFFIAIADHHEFAAWPTRPSFIYTEFLKACLAFTQD